MSSISKQIGAGRIGIKHILCLIGFLVGLDVFYVKIFPLSDWSETKLCKYALDDKIDIGPSVLKFKHEICL